MKSFEFELKQRMLSDLITFKVEQDGNKVTITSPLTRHFIDMADFESPKHAVDVFLYLYTGYRTNTHFYKQYYQMKGK